MHRENLDQYITNGCFTFLFKFHKHFEEIFTWERFVCIIIFLKLDGHETLIFIVSAEQVKFRFPTNVLCECGIGRIDRLRMIHRMSVLTLPCQDFKLVLFTT